MTEPPKSRPMFVRLDKVDPVTGDLLPSSFESIDAEMRRRHPVPEHFPEVIRGRLDAARHYFALAFEQANAGRLDLFIELANDAVVKATLALEIALRAQPGGSLTAPLGRLVNDAASHGLIAGDVDAQELWRLLTEARNDIAHHNDTRMTFGPAAGTWIAIITDQIARIYPPPAQSDTT